VSWGSLTSTVAGAIAVIAAPQVFQSLSVSARGYVGTPEEVHAPEAWDLLVNIATRRGASSLP